MRIIAVILALSGWFTRVTFRCSSGYCGMCHKVPCSGHCSFCYTAELFGVIGAHRTTSHFYADDGQLYVNCPAADTEVMHH